MPPNSGPGAHNSDPGHTTPNSTVKSSGWLRSEL